MAIPRVHNLVLAMSLAGCPGNGTGEATGTTAEPASTSVADPTTGSTSTGSTSSTSTHPTTGGSTHDTSTTGGHSDTGTSSTGETTAGTTSTSGGTTFDGTTSDTDGPVDPSCTYPGSTSDGPVAPDLAPECACIDDQGSLVCAASLCPTISGSCDEFGFGNECHGTWTYNVEALDCALKAARDGTEGTLSWYFSPNGGFSLHHGFLHIVPERRAIRQDGHKVDLGGSVTDTELWTLKDSQYFQGCLEMDTLCARMNCFFAGTEGESLSLCLASFDYSDT